MEIAHFGYALRCVLFYSAYTSWAKRVQLQKVSVGVGNTFCPLEYYPNECRPQHIPGSAFARYIYDATDAAKGLPFLTRSENVCIISTSRCGRLGNTHKLTSPHGTAKIVVAGANIMCPARHSPKLYKQICKTNANCVQTLPILKSPFTTEQRVCPQPSSHTYKECVRVVKRQEAWEVWSNVRGISFHFSPCIFLLFLQFPHQRKTPRTHKHILSHIHLWLLNGKCTIYRNVIK